MKPYAVIVALLMVGNLFADDSKTNEESSLPGFESSVPTGVQINWGESKSDQVTDGFKLLPRARNGGSFSVGAQGGLYGQFGDLESGALSDVVITAAFDLGIVAFELGINPSELINSSVNSDFDETKTRSNGITSNLDPDVISTARAIVTPFAYGKDGKEMAAVTIVVGRDSVNQLGQTTFHAWTPGLSTLIHRELGQQDLIKVQAHLFGNICVEIVNFGYDWLGYNNDSNENITQDGGDSWAVNVGTTLADLLGDGNNLTVWFSYVDVKDGITYTRALSGDQPGANTTYAGGVRANIGSLTISGEGYVMDTEASDDDETGAEVSLAYQIDRITPFVGAGWLDNGSTSDVIYRLGAGYAVAENIMFALGVEFVRPDAGDETENVYAKLSVSPSLVDVSPTKNEN